MSGTHPEETPLPEKTLLLVDGSSYLYRAFHALPELKSPKGEPTGAIYGVLNMLRKLASDYKAQARACVFDAKGKTFRDEAYAEYKATRTAMPDDLSRQVEPLKEAVAALGWPVLTIDGVEADDVIATLVDEATRKGWRSVISTGDKDLTQLVDEHVLWVNTMSNETLDREGVTKKFGVPPEKIVDYLTLVGDAIDNIPGVDKVGPKTACKWIVQYGSIEGVIAHADEIAGQAGENLRKVLDWLPKARSLVTVKRDVPLDVTLEKLSEEKPDLERQRALYERFGFKGLLREAQGASSSAVQAPQPQEPRAAGPVKRKYSAIVEEGQLRALLDRLASAPLVGIDTQCVGSEPLSARLVGMAFAFGEEACYLPLAHDYPAAPAQIPLDRALAALKPWLEDPRRIKVAQDAKLDSHVLANAGIRLAGCEHDTLVESYVLEVHERRDLGALALRHCGWTTTGYDEVTGKGVGRIPFSAVDIPRATQYAAESADCTLALHTILFEKIKADDKLDFVYERIDMPVLPVLFRMERNGVLLDAAKLEAQSHELGKEMLAIEQKAYAAAGQPFNLGSPKQIQEILFDRQKLPVRKKTPSGQPSTDEDVLAELALDHPLPKLILEYRSLSKLKSTYTDKLPRNVDASTGRVHTTYSQTTAVTGRLASNDPNLQNIPIRTPQGRRIREAFVAPPGSRIVSADYSQIELRIMAHLSSDDGLLGAFAADRDIHQATASEVFGTPLDAVTADQRRSAKAVNFGLIYGMSAFGLSKQLGIPRGTAQEYIDLYFARYPGVKRYMEETRAQARSQGYVETVFGRRLYLPDINSRNKQFQQAAERAAINAPMQGTAADIIKRAMIAVDRMCTERGGARLIMQVHDELVLEVEAARVADVGAAVREHMMNAAALRVPLRVDLGTGPDWDKAH